MQKMSVQILAKRDLSIQAVLPLLQKKHGAKPEKLSDIQRRLSDLLKSDLTFKGEKTSYASHNIHAFAAKFPPQLPQTFINELTEPGERVLDPMAGSGTTLIEAVFARRFGIGVDLDPLASLICKVKSSPIDLAEYKETGEKVWEETKKKVRPADEIGRASCRERV